MLFMIAALIVVGGALIIRKARVAYAVPKANFGSMSEQWLAEHSASHRA
jgi:hypothetical protein